MKSDVVVETEATLGRGLANKTRRGAGNIASPSKRHASYKA